jgi:hypothetical protein
MQRAQRVGVFPAKRHAPLQRQGLREDQPAVQRIGEAQAGRDPERQPRIHAAEQAADRGSQNESGAKGDADLAEHRGALFRRRHIRDIGERRRDVGCGDARDHAADEQPAQGRRQRHQHIVQPEPEIRQQHHRPAAKPIRQAAEDRREEKLHRRPYRAEQAEHPRRTGGVVVEEAFHELGQDRHDQAEREHVEQYRDEDKRHRRAACRRCLQHSGRQGKLRLPDRTRPARVKAHPDGRRKSYALTGHLHRPEASFCARYLLPTYNLNG